MDVEKHRSLSSGVGLPVRGTAGAFRYLGPGFLTLQIVIWVPGCTLDESGFDALAISSDTTPPSAPKPLTATAVSSAEINLAWTGATDNIAVTGYLIERCQDAGCSNFAQIATATGLAFNDTGLARSTSYSYRVRATDAAANLGPYSNTASATTSAIIDTEPPTAPTS